MMMMMMMTTTTMTMTTKNRDNMRKTNGWYYFHWRAVFHKFICISGNFVISWYALFMMSLDHEIHFDLSAFHETAKYQDRTRESYFIWRDFLATILCFAFRQITLHYAKNDNLFYSKASCFLTEFQLGGKTRLIEYCRIILIL